MDVMKFCLVLCVVVATTYARCNFPPRLWCSSKEIAKSCHVFQQCKEWNTPVQMAPPVNFTLYYESLCPDCKHFMTTMLYRVFQQIGHIMNLSLVPYGNARETKEGNHWKFECQHGKQECVGNVIETCAIRLVNNIPKVFGFIHCMEKSIKLPLHAAKQCAKMYPNIPLNKVLLCANGTQGNEWEHQMALQTQALQPPHQYVPWVTLNGIHTEEIQNEAEKDLLKLICDTYTGTKPSACHQKESIRRCQNK
ncbi:gamma-interferon-inducible lysosomal thiol reductase-like [Gigantopelta aegis]|uniref:gamma-interferon-inducible lysosomal thiol reductase-like n=1 Tax=Gigantopelta aegis TaxID=1735272 RepID=UPI001B88B584|nr:gamma-interferon-inducible lysosomal thiol reductase-like [Gigantopelta aegis]